ncbi:chromosome segregation protein SMC [Methanoculleus bourgensis]|uniref:Chromosome partition protein Smc n=1 Tax=Methanoculleus bourgensis TaxID=83986 RepID=A0A0X3BIF7_9EURY|nr:MULTISPECIES: chromosome segregation protein SMC [Methanoculleus]MBT0733806.1 chromosome segregation protein SMC [Methanoculleus bourgensis]NMA88141.1 chromosome segregation protein SMC [Methanoculleus bourgensis]NQS77477.1 chromosome segregation protein SMC [Methanoculleus bourgensis]CVK31917.1 Chromosome partition protein smc homolog [Methanoculleus bourgensis]SAI87700.1 Chromosome partition protein smc [Methanoculleus bourgensis]
MYITHLEIDNFKSFARKTKIPFFEGFTVISGPNGSGKSNIIDSILFVLALSGARGLRAEKLTDLINVNTGKNTAEVGVTFSDGTTIRRRIKRTPAGYYSYNYLNGRLCKQGDVIEFLAKLGVKPEGYNVVMQGDITRIMEMSDGERRKIIDEIAGVAEFDSKREQALSELEVVRERIEREEILLGELAARLDALQHEREQAIEYRRWQEQLEHFGRCRGAALVRQKEQEIGTLHDLMRDQQAEVVRITGETEAATARLEEARERQRAVDDEINRKSGPEYLDLVGRLEEARGGIKLAEKTIERLMANRNENLEAVQRVYMDSRRAEAKVEECAGQIRNLSIDRANLAMELSGQREQMKAIEERIAGESKEVEGLKDQLFARLQDLESKKELRAKILREQDIFIEKSRMRTSERERLEARIRQIDEELANKQEQVTEYSSCMADCEAQKREVEREISDVESTLFARRSALDRLQKEIRENEQELMRFEAQQQAQGDAGGRAMEFVLGMDGAHGTVAQLGRAPPEYATALDIAAMGRLRWVIVDNDGIASDAIRYLRENRLGRVTFLPLNKLRVPILSPLEADPGIIGYAVDLLEFDPAFERAFRVVFGATVVVDTLERARRLMGRYRMVTLDGDFVEKSGAMTGGVQKKKIRGFGVAVDDEITRVRATLAGLEAEAAEIGASIGRLAEVSEAKRAERSAVDEQVARYRMLTEEFSKRIEVLTGEKQTLEATLREMLRDAKTGGEELARLEADLERTADEIARISGEVDDLKKKLDDTEIPALTGQYEDLRRAVEDIERRLRNKDADITDAKRERQHFANRVEELTAERDRLVAKNQEIDGEIAAAGEEIEGRRRLIVQLEARQKEFSDELAGLHEKRDRVLGEIRSLDREVLELTGAMERVRMQIDALVERERSLLAELAALREQAGDVETDLDLAAIDAGIAEAERALKKIGAVNMLAIEECDRVSTRVEERTAKKEVLSRERTMLLERIEKYEKMKYDAFMTAYRAIDANFQEIFARLTEGSGRLVLDNEEDPFSGGMTFAVQPRDKKVHLLSALSGGEKSLTTLAFIFSIQQYMPAPFYALDEVDMFLDGSNVGRIAAMISELSGNAQSIIVSLRKPMIERADRIVGVTIRPDKSTYVTGVQNNG